MKLLQPALISGEILNLFDESDEKVIIISPYVKIDKWYKIQNKFATLKKRNIKIEFYIRDDSYNSVSFEQVRNLGIDPIGIPDLHTKLYMNEKTAIVTSMNLLLSSENKSLDIGYRTETVKEYNELLEYYNRYIKNWQLSKTSSYLDWRDQLFETLDKKFDYVRINSKENILDIRTYKNNYQCLIASEKGKNLLRISGILSKDDYDRAKPQLEQMNSRSGLNFELIAGKERYYDSMWCTLASDLKSTTIDGIQQPEQDMAINSILKFITEVERIKSE